MCDRTTSPKWNEAFCFLVQDPRQEILVVKVCWLQCVVKVEQMSVMQMQIVWSLIFKHSYPSPFVVFPQLSHSWTLPIGSLVVPIRELLSEPGLVLDQWFNLDGASPESQVLLRAELMVGKLSICCFIIFYIFIF